MRAMVALENRFYRTKNGSVYSNNIFDYSVWKRYLQVFDEVVICARLLDIHEEGSDKSLANGPGVSFFELPMYVGPVQYLAKHYKLKALIKESVNYADAFILRVPGTISTLLWHELEKMNIPYGVEVVGSALDSANTCGVNFAARHFLSKIGYKTQRLQCQNAIAAAYVTKDYLQKHYPPGNWTTYYSSIDLPENAIISEEQLETKLNSYEQQFDGKRPFHICHVGSMGALYKAQDILIEAVAECNKKGFNVELELLGDGKYRAFFENKAKSFGIDEKVFFQGNLSPGQSVRDRLDQSDLFVLPSLTEGLPRAIVEAMARGLPVIGSSVGGIPELVDPEMLVRPGNVQALVSKINRVISHKHDFVNIARRNLKKSHEYKYNKLNERRIEFYRKVASFNNNKGAYGVIS
ncbi:glycosyltransferase family 4 protein [Candidatus Pacearchaeota archaeon]|nr:glycosyltransferase family 4 protein [Candidatus Pacearchaeota archaeon]